ncbi:hypothetical protein Q9L58_006551 [Maublancomyces gigas]|uniref:BTB domain-containing protein n=1 Tax=Discina gigas TaxID=1032678 RepID=A0ABR3GF05_9PEZI
MSENNEMSPSRYASTPGRDMTSEVYELVSSDNVSFFVHKDILISQSMPFRQAANGPWQEASERKILLDDWDTDTVARLVEFLYSNDYPYPDPDHLVVPSTPSAPVAPVAPVAPLICPSRPLTPLDECLKQWMRPSRRDKVADLQRLGPCDPAKFDYESVLLLHARVYVLANYKAVQHLQTLALKRLSLVLQRLHPLEMGSHTAGNVAEFASYVYANTVLLSVSEDPLRKLTSHFIALNVVAFQKEARAVKLMAEGGDLVTDVMAKVCIRIVDPNDTCPECSSPRMRYISGIEVSPGSNPDVRISYLFLVQVVLGSWADPASSVREKNGDGNINAGGDT